MSQENVEIVRAAIDAGNRVDIEAVLALMGPEPEWVNSPTAIEPGVRRGRDEVAAVMRALSESLTDGRWEVDRIYDRGEEVIALGRVSRRMPGSDARLEDRSLMSYKIRSRKIVQIQVLGFGRDEVQAASTPPGCRGRRCRRRTWRSCAAWSRRSMKRRMMPRPGSTAVPPGRRVRSAARVARRPHLSRAPRHLPAGSAVDEQLR